MGCCLSSPATNNQTPKSNPDVFPPSRRSHSPESDTDRRRAPPPPLLEEETVKEVLSETPIPKPFIPITNDSDRKRDPQQPLVGEEAKIQPMAVMKPAEEIVSEVSEVSEMYSYSESLSAVTDKREDDGEVTQRVQRSPAKVPRKRPCSADLARGKERGIRSPARRYEPSPVKRNHVTPRSVQGPPATTKTAGARRNVGPPNSIRRDAGEGSGRRSRSPAIRGDVGAGRPPRSKIPTPSRIPTERCSSRPPVATAENGGERGKGKDETLPESLENPLVSLECFIFL